MMSNQLSQPSSARIPVARLTRFVRLGQRRMTLRCHLEDFTPDDARELVGHVRQLRLDLARVLNDLRHHSRATAAHVRRWFPGVEGRDQLAELRQVYRHIAAGLDRGVTPLYDDPDDPDFGQTSTFAVRPDLRFDADGRIARTGDSIGIGRRYHAASGDPRLDAAARYSTLAHELAHFYGGRGPDHGYFDLADALRDVERPVAYCKDGRPVELTAAQLLDNADSFAGLLVQFSLTPPRRIS
jgi:hypothetical protein